MYRSLLVAFLLSAATFVAHAVSPSNQFQQRLLQLQRQSSCVDLPKLGVNIHRGRNPDDVNLRLISEVGAQMVRLELPWIDIEHQDQYDFGPFDYLINELRQNRKSIVFGLAYGHPQHSDGRAANGFPLPPHTPEQRAAYGRYAQAVARRYHGPDIAYEIWNEPNLDLFWPPTFDADSYGKLLATAANAIREIEPTAVIIPAGLANENDPPRFLRALAAAGALDAVDGITFHPYRQDGPENSLHDIAEFENAAVGGGTARPLWITEWGYSESWLAKLGPNTRRRQAVMIARMMLTAALAKAKVALVYDLIDDGTDPHDQESVFGLFNYDFKAKEAATAFRIVAGLISACNGYEFKVDPASSTITARFDFDAKVFYVIWTYEPGRRPDVCFTIPHARPVELQDASGDAIPIESCGSGSQIRLALSEAAGPVILQTESNSFK